QQLVLTGTAGLTLLPLADPKFTKAMPEESLRLCLPHLKALESKCEDDFSRRCCNLMLLSVSRKLGLAKEAAEAVAALQAKDGQFREASFDDEVRKLLSRVRELLQLIAAFDLAQSNGRLAPQ